MQAENAPPEACPRGFGDGEYAPLGPSKVRSIVKIVGTAHVRGMADGWEEAVAAPLEVGALLRDPNAPSLASPDESPKV